ncbi:hypothetical protein INS49_002422 [Diaporthe citri]|uniref:uncharacterized protein n=1 Tax=Diaporthe citri TaxID=83186 RepID=UPI001C80082A|nr:uncharacterized protein INS49_002422 [Diaporthe citri]KAG6368221.1 hypothetical protein INS49_002422 [Diaporthe citri]
MKEREQLIAWDIENRIAVFMVVVAEETGGLPNDFDHWAEDAGAENTYSNGAWGSAGDGKGWGGVLTDEACREHEALIRYVQLGIDPLFIILTGDYRQDMPYAASMNVNVKDKNEMLASHFNIFLNQYLTTLPQHMMEQVPEHVVLLSDNFRQQGGLQELASQLFYDGKMRTSFDPLDADALTLTWHKFGQELVNENRKRR